MKRVWFLFYGPSIHFLGHFGRGRLTYPHCSWASLLGSLPVLSAHSVVSNWQLLFLNLRKRENGHRNVFMTKSPRKTVSDVGIELGPACMPSELASDQATAPSSMKKWLVQFAKTEQTTRHKRVNNRNVSKVLDRQVWANSVGPDSTAPRVHASQSLGC